MAERFMRANRQAWEAIVRGTPLVHGNSRAARGWSDVETGLMPRLTAGFLERWQQTTPAQRNCVRQRCQGLSIAEVAGRYKITPSAVKNHIWRVVAMVDPDNSKSSGKMERLCYLVGRMDAIEEHKK